MSFLTQFAKMAEEQTLITRMLTRKLGELNPETIDSFACAKGDRIHQLTLEQLEALDDALLDFNAIAEHRLHRIERQF